MPLSDRQKLLWDRLIVLGRWARDQELPAQVLEIGGFGSFFRGKTNPTDVDIFMRVQRREHSPQFLRFMDCVETIRWDPKYQRKFGTPSEAMKVLLHRRSVENGSDDHRRFIEWLDGYSWNLLIPATVIDQATMKLPDGFMTRFIKRRLPRVNVLRLLNSDATNPRPDSLRCGFTVSIWSVEAPDMAENLADVLAPDVVAMNVGRELAYFDCMIPLLIGQRDRIRGEVAYLRRLRRSRKTRDGGVWWFERLSAGDEVLRSLRDAEANAKARVDRFDSEVWGSVASPASHRADLGSAIEAADRSRKEIKALNDEIDLLECIKKHFVQFHSSPRKAETTAEEYVAEQILSTGTATFRKKGHALMQEMRFLDPRR